MGPRLAISPPFNSLHVYQYAHSLNYIDAPQAFPLMESLDSLQPGSSSFLTASLSVSHVHIRPLTSEEKQKLSNNKIIHTSNITKTHTHSWQQQYLSAFPFNCQINICSCQSPTHRIMCAFSLLPRGFGISRCYYGLCRKTETVGICQAPRAMKSKIL